MPGRPTTQASADASAGLSAEAAETSNNEKVLCQHCQRTATNGIRCLGMCVADSDY
ncbi:hypothetical protein [Synechococcus sp. KORDI-100]|uniref:hypothetical protein n=1 Tax=Synechococcus sp. KORDI-100 TaxID=1280380 RepID=UPI0012E08003|nr:hypothetical protein [Synechococcus sp. KORDI-100]